MLTFSTTHATKLRNNFSQIFCSIQEKKSNLSLRLQDYTYLCSWDLHICTLSTAAVFVPFQYIYPLSKCLLKLSEIIGRKHILKNGLLSLLHFLKKIKISGSQLIQENYKASINSPNCAE